MDLPEGESGDDLRDAAADPTDTGMESAPDAPTCPPAVDARSPPNISSGGLEQITIMNAWSSSTISVCWDGAGSEDEKRWIRDASADSWEAVSAVRFEGWLPCTQAGADIRMRVAPTCGARPPIGDEAQQSPGGLVFDPAVPGCSLDHQACIRAQAVHLLGHALGFDHSDNPSDLSSACVSPRGQFDSVMSYCSSKPFLGNALLGAADIVQVLKTYGAGPSPFIFQDSAAGLRQVATISQTGEYRTRALYYVSDGTTAADQVVAGRNGSLLLYSRRDGGHLDVGTLTGDSSFSLDGSVDSIGNWKTITAAQNGYFLFFDPLREGGLISIRRIDARGGYRGEVSRVADVGTGWSDVVGLVNGEVFLYDGVSATGQAARITSDGTFEVQGQPIRGLSTYASIAAVNMRGLFLYSDDVSKQLGGRADLATLGESGEFALAGVQTGLPAHVENLIGARNGSLLSYGDQSDPLGPIHADVHIMMPGGALMLVAEVPGLMAFDTMSAD